MEVPRVANQITAPHSAVDLTNSLNSLSEMTPDEYAVESLEPEVIQLLLDEIENFAEVMTDGQFNIESNEENFEWWVNKLANFDSEIERRERAHKAKIAQLKRAREALYARYKDQAIKYTLKYLGNGKKRSFDLGCGVRVGFRKSNAKLDFQDGFEPVPGNDLFDKLRNFCEENVSIRPELSEAIRTKYDVLKTPLNLWWKGDPKNGIEPIGEIPPGMKLIPENPNEWYIQAKE